VVGDLLPNKKSKIEFFMKDTVGCFCFGNGVYYFATRNFSVAGTYMNIYGMGDG